MFESLKTSFLAILYRVSVPIAKFSGRRLLRLPPPTEKEAFRKWGLWLCQNRILPLVQLTPTELDDKILDVVKNALLDPLLFDLVWGKLHGIEPINYEPDNPTKLSFFEKIKKLLRRRIDEARPDDEVADYASESEATSDAQAGSVLTAVWIFGLIMQTPVAIKNIFDLMDFIQNRLGTANGEF
jgi:hypothetical protein